MIINFIEVAIKERGEKKEWITCKTLACHLLSLGGKKKKWHLHWTLYKTVRKGHNDQDIVIFTDGIFQTIYITVDFFLYSPLMVIHYIHGVCS